MTILTDLKVKDLMMKKKITATKHFWRAPSASLFFQHGSQNSLSAFAVTFLEH